MPPPKLILVSGPSGVGKGKICAELTKLCPDLPHTVSHTTRARRPGEIEGKHYHFIARTTFREMIDAGEFLEWHEYEGNGHLYGTHCSEPEENVTKIAEIEVNGARQVKERLPGTPMILILPDSRDAWRQRLIGRGTETPEIIVRRIATGLTELAEGPALADYFVINEEGPQGPLYAAIRIMEIIEQLTLP
jgi:guanylate kinase